MSETETGETSRHITADLDSLVAALRSADAVLADRVLESLEQAFGTSAVSRDSLRRCRTLIAGTADGALPVPESAEALSTVRVAAGTISADGSCVLGHDGYLFLTDGSNHVLSRYDRDPESTRDLGSRWCQLFDARAQRQRNGGRLFIQFIVPEKISALPDLLPFQLRTPTDLLAKIEEHLRSDSWTGRTIPVLDLFRIGGPRTFARLDSHQSAYGSYLVAHHMASMFGYRGLFGLNFSRRIIKTGDLAYRFFGTPLFEELVYPDFTNHPVLSVEPEAVGAENPPDGGHVGSRYIWRNPKAPIRMRVVAFGNSCLERGGFPAISWWFARLFEEFHFVWSSEVDDEYSSSIRADLVIAQTMERFLFVNEVPST